jgi:hypothetical protein
MGICDGLVSLVNSTMSCAESVGAQASKRHLQKLHSEGWSLDSHKMGPLCSQGIEPLCLLDGPIFRESRTFIILFQ